MNEVQKLFYFSPANGDKCIMLFHFIRPFIFAGQITFLIEEPGNILPAQLLLEEQAVPQHEGRSAGGDDGAAGA